MTQEKEIMPNEEIIEYLVGLVKNTPEWKENVDDNFGIEIINETLQGLSAYELMIKYDVKYSRIRNYLMKAVNLNPKFGDKILELYKLVDETPDWEKYVSKKTAEVVKFVFEKQSTDEAIEHFNMKYTTVRSHLLRALDRVGEKNTEFKRYGKSDQAQELFELMDTNSDWKDYVTDNEAFLAEKFREVKNFYELGRLLNLAPSNIAGTLYGTTQKIGVIGKIKQKLPQIDRRDIDKRREEEQQAE